MAERGERKAKRRASTPRPRRARAVVRYTLLILITLGLGVALTAAGRAWSEPPAAALTDFRIAAGAALAAVFAGALHLLGELRAVKRPARALAKAMAELEAAAEMDRPVKVAAEGELKALVEGYNRMVGQVEARRRDAAEQLYILEQLAQLRTADLAEAKLALSAAEAAHADLAGTLRHELAAPLEGLSRVADSLAAAPPPRPLARTLAGVAASLAGTVRDLVAGRDGGAEPGMIEVADCAEDVAALFWAAATAKGLDLAVYVDPATPKTIQGDPLRLRQVLTSLVGAAVQATETGGVLIEVEPDSPASIRLCVRDTRSPDDGEPADPPGFARCRRLVESMDGRFQTSRDERGAAHAFRLPAVLLEPPSAWPEPPEPGAAARIACDGVATRRVLSRYLARAGYALPSGPDVTAELVIAGPAALTVPPTAPTICIAADAERGERAVKTGAAHAVLVQPFRRAELSNLLAQRQLGEALGAAPAAEAAPPPVPLAAALAPLPPLTPAPAVRKTPPAEAEALLADLEQAIADDALTLVYQPQFDREGREITGVETLVRWVHPTRGAVSPALFIPMAEEYGRIHRLTDWVMARALMETADLAGLQVAFNASAIEFTDAGIVARIGDLLSRTGFDPRRLEVEITETAILENEEQVRDNMNALRAMGLKVALDDFGAGYSSLGHLRRYPFDKLKIDREFVIDCTRDVQSATVVHAVVSIGRALGMRVVAEGVETEHQRQFLKIAGVHAMQGYLFGKPMPVDALRATLAEVDASARMG